MLMKLICALSGHLWCWLAREALLDQCSRCKAVRLHDPSARKLW